MDMDMDSNSTPGPEGEVQTLRLEVNKLMEAVTTLQKQQNKTLDKDKLIAVLKEFFTDRKYHIGDQRLVLELEEKMCQEVISLGSTTTTTNSTCTKELQSWRLQLQPLVEVDDKDNDEEGEVEQLGGTVEVGTRVVRVSSKPEESLLGYLGRVSDTDLVKPTSEVASRIVKAIKACSLTIMSNVTRTSGKSNLYEDCLSAVRSFPTCFTHTDVVDLLVSVVRFCNRDGGQSANVKSAVFAINLLTSAFQDEEYPLVFTEMFMEDAVEGRYWVDQTYCSRFVENLRRSFGTKPSPDDLLLGLDGSASAPLRKYLEFNYKDLTTALKKHNDLMTTSPASSRYNRKESKEAEVGKLIVNFATEAMLKTGNDALGLPEVSRNLLKTLSFACGLLPVRVFVVSHLEQWLANPKCSRQAQQLLLALCVNSNGNGNVDAEVVVDIARLRIKSKPVSEFFCLAIRELVKGGESNMRNVVTQVMYNELSLTRNPNNLMILGTIVPSSAEALGIFAEVILDLLQKEEDFQNFHPAIRQIMCEIQRASHYECSLLPFLEGLFYREVSWRDAEVRDRAFKAITDLVLFSMFLSCPPGLRLGDVDRYEEAARVKIAKMREVALRWMYMYVQNVYQPSKKDYITAFKKLLLKDPGTDLQSQNGFPSEEQRAAFAKLCARVPLSELSIMWLLFNSFNSANPYKKNLTNLTHIEIFDYADYLIMKAAAANCLLPIQNPDIIELLFRVTQYKRPENCQLPAGYEPPSLAIKQNYWRVWILLLVLSSENPSTLGKLAFESYPTLRALMQMCMTNHFSFSTHSSPSMEEIMTKERQLVVKERQQILEFEGYRVPAAPWFKNKNVDNVVTEENSVLIYQVMSWDPLGPCRCPPPIVLSRLQKLNERLGLGVKLSNSRNPNFLEMGAGGTQTKNAQDEGHGRQEGTAGKRRTSPQLPPKRAKRTNVQLKPTNLELIS